jgi:TRAP-type uncharacterized transport system fused permease subunit
MQTCESLRLICQRQWYNYISVRNLISALKSNDHNVPRVQSVSTCAIYTYLTNKSPPVAWFKKKTKKSSVRAGVLSSSALICTQLSSVSDRGQWVSVSYRSSNLVSELYIICRSSCAPFLPPDTGLYNFSTGQQTLKAFVASKV